MELRRQNFPEVRWVKVSQLRLPAEVGLADNPQRPTSSKQVKQMGPFDPRLWEMPTVVYDADGDHYRSIEGGHRFALARKCLAPDDEVPVGVLDLAPGEEVKVFLGVNTSRRAQDASTRFHARVMAAEAKLACAMCAEPVRGKGDMASVDGQLVTLRGQWVHFECVAADEAAFWTLVWHNGLETSDGNCVEAPRGLRADVTAR